MRHDRPTREQVNRMASILESIYPTRYKMRGTARADVVRCHRELADEERAQVEAWI